MNPYLEAPGVWESVHPSLIVYTAAALNRVLPQPYVAVVEEWLRIVPADRRIRPDVVVADAQRGPRPSGAAAVLVSRTGIADAPVIVEEAEDEPRQRFINIVRGRDEGDVVATIEYLSHANKSPGADRDSYLRKQRTVCRGLTHLIEIDLLRSGAHTLALPLERLDNGPFDYIVCLHRGGTGRRFECWPVTVREPLPRISVPLESGLPDVPLDLQAVLSRAYDEGAYDRLIDYGRDPIPPLPADDAAWASALLAARK
jgi:hypothetical protein